MAEMQDSQNPEPPKLKRPTFSPDQIRAKQEEAQEQQAQARKKMPRGKPTRPKASSPKPQNKTQTKIPSCWLGENEISPDRHASFVEYLRWGRVPNEDDAEIVKNIAMLDLLQKAQTRSYRDRLNTLHLRLKSLIGDQGYLMNVHCPDRVRVGGIRGPEEMLLPAFDAMGIPYWPSTTLRGVAHRAAITETSNQEDAETFVKKHFGSIDPHGGVMGKVIFFDAYPCIKNDNLSWLSIDIVNSLWRWEGKNLAYQAIPNTFLSLQNVEFEVGIRPAAHCSTTEFDQVQHWLELGLLEGIGAQVNSGYGRLDVNHRKDSPMVELSPLIDVRFELNGQFMHGPQNFNRPNDNNRQGQKLNKLVNAVQECRPIAFKSILRYWFRTFSLGIVPDQSQVQLWENQIFGGILPKAKLGYLRVNILEQKNQEHQTGRLVIKLSSQVPKEKQDSISSLIQELTWMMSQLGSVGLGARRPLHRRDSKPYWRGSDLVLTPTDKTDGFWQIPTGMTNYFICFKQHLIQLYQSLAKVYGIASNPLMLIEATPVTGEIWEEAIDRYSALVLCCGEGSETKPYALRILHDQDLKSKNAKGEIIGYDPHLCGSTEQPSPVWIAETKAIQVVTVFGASCGKRKLFLEKLESDTFPNLYRDVLQSLIEDGVIQG